MTPAELLTPEAVRNRSGALLALAEAGTLPGWRLHPDRLPDAAALVAAEVRGRYPDLVVPFHARWRHFPPGSWEALRESLPPDPAERARSAFDLAITSVLLDAGAGMAWRYRTAGGVYARSEGLAVASLAMVAAGDFGAPGRVTAAGLADVTAAGLAAGFQAGPGNPLVGLDGRAALLRRLGATLAADPAFPTGRPGDLFDLLAGRAAGGALPAREILIALLRHLGPIWPGRITLGGVNLGDCWHHPSLLGDGPAGDGLVPFHKLSQWLAYSLVEPLEEASIRVVEIDALTGLAEYRNGGLFLDAGVIALADPADAAREHAPDSPLIIGWRGLTVALLDRLAPLVRVELVVADFPLARMLEGGSWWAGRRLAQARRADGGPPLRVLSDGTLF